VSTTPWLTVAQVAESEQVSPRTVHRWIADGKLRSRRQPSGRLRIHAVWYAEMIERGAPPPRKRARFGGDKEVERCR
jgi:excisionase family DNA binding protein